MLVALLDHEDVQKARKSLIVSSSFLIFLHHIDIISGEMDLLGLKLALQGGAPLAFAKVLTTYLALMYGLRVFEFTIDDQTSRTKERASRYVSNEIRRSYERDEEPNVEEIIRGEVDRAVYESTRKLNLAKRSAWMVSEVFIPYSVFLTAIFYQKTLFTYFGIITRTLN